MISKDISEIGEIIYNRLWFSRIFRDNIWCGTDQPEIKYPAHGTHYYYHEPQ